MQSNRIISFIFFQLENKAHFDIAALSVNQAIMFYVGIVFFYSFSSFSTF